MTSEYATASFSDIMLYWGKYRSDHMSTVNINIVILSDFMHRKI